MRIESLRISGYRSIHELEITLPSSGLCAIVGENNAGKSNLLRALDLLLGESHPVFRDYDEDAFFDHVTSSPFLIEARFGGDLVEAEFNYQPSHVAGCRLEGKSQGRSSFEIVNTEGVTNTYVRTETREQMGIGYIEADRRLDYHLGYASRFTLMSRLSRSFSRKLRDHYPATKEKIDQLKDDLIAAFREVSEFAEFESNLQSTFAEQIRQEQYGIELSFEALNPLDYFRRVEVIAREFGHERDLAQLGQGMQNLLMLAFFRSYAKAFRSDAIIVIEEPEVFLHPQAQRYLYGVMRDLTDAGTQIIYATHSQEFVSPEHFDEVILVRRDVDVPGATCKATRAIRVDGATLVERCHITGAPKAAPANIKPYYANSPAARAAEGFFARAVVIVEGATEEMALPIVFKALGLDVDRQGVSIISVGGKNNVARYWRLYSAFEIPCYCIFDSDEGSAGEYDRANTELARLFDVDDVSNIHTAHVTPRCTVFERDFETAFKKGLDEFSIPTELSWDSLIAQAKVELDTHSKPLLARYAVQRLTNGGTDGQYVPAYFRDIRETLGALAP